MADRQSTRQRTTDEAELERHVQDMLRDERDKAPGRRTSGETDAEQGPPERRGDRPRAAPGASDASDATREDR